MWKIKNVGFFYFFFKLLPNFIDFKNSEDCIGKITSKSVAQFLLKKYFHIIRNWIISGEKMRNLNNYNCYYAHSFFGKDF